MIVGPGPVADPRPQIHVIMCVVGKQGSVGDGRYLVVDAKCFFNAELVSQIDSRRQSGQPGIDMTGLDAAFVGSGTVRRYRLQARVSAADGGAYLVTRYVDINPRSRDGFPWTTFHMQREVEPVPPRSSP